MEACGARARDSSSEPGQARGALRAGLAGLSGRPGARSVGMHVSYALTTSKVPFLTSRAATFEAHASSSDPFVRAIRDSWRTAARRAMEEPEPAAQLGFAAALAAAIGLAGVAFFLLRERRAVAAPAPAARAQALTEEEHKVPRDTAAAQRH